MHCFIFLLALCSRHLRQSVHFSVATNDIVSRLAEVHCSNTWHREQHHRKFQMSSPEVTENVQPKWYTRCCLVCFFFCLFILKMALSYAGFNWPAAGHLSTPYTVVRSDNFLLDAYCKLELSVYGHLLLVAYLSLLK